MDEWDDAFHLDPGTNGLEEDTVVYRDGRIQRFEDLVAWQRARELATDVYALTRSSPIRSDLSLQNQMQRAAVSIMSNIAEGYERGSSREFHRFLTIAKASCAEVRSLLYLAYDVGYLSPDTFEQHLAHAARVGQVIGALRVSVAKRIARNA